MKNLALALLFAFLLPAVLTLTTNTDPACSIIANRGGLSVTVDSGPCYRRDFPVWCKALIPATIIQGQTVRCERPAVVVTATPTRIPTPTPTATPRAVTERLRDALLFPRFR